MLDDDAMARDPRKLTHFQRLAALTQELASPASVRMADQFMELNAQERQEIAALRQMALMRHGAVVPPAPPHAPAAATGAPEAPQGLGPTVQTVTQLVEKYQATNQYRQLGFKTRKFYDRVTRQLLQTFADANLADIKIPEIQRLYDFWSKNGTKPSMGHALVAQFRIYVNYGATILELPECVRLSVLLRAMHFRLPRVRTERLTEDHARLIIARSHRQGRDSIGLAQALQFECPLRQIDVIGLWIPQSEPGFSDLPFGDKKWMRGLRWSAIDKNLILRTTQGSKEIEVDLRQCPLVMAELKRLDTIPTSGPVILDEDTGQPYDPDKFRELWRTIANSAGVPKNVKNMDSPGGKGLPKAKASAATVTR
jgi:hypothetical protein